MNKKKNIRLGSVARKLNIGTTSIVNYLEKIGFKIINKPNTKITLEQFNILASEFINSAIDKKEASKLNIGNNNEINNTDIKDFENKENIKVEKNTSIENAEKDTKNIEQKNTKVEDIKENKENENRTKLTVIGKIQLPMY